jgi:hypothetical protein
MLLNLAFMSYCCLSSDNRTAEVKPAREELSGDCSSMLEPRSYLFSSHQSSDHEYLIDVAKIISGILSGHPPSHSHGDGDEDVSNVFGHHADEKVVSNPRRNTFGYVYT